MQNFLNRYLFILLAFILFGCNTPAQITAMPPETVNTPEVATITLHPTIAATETPLPERFTALEKTGIQRLDYNNVWTGSGRDKMTIYPPDILWDYVYEKDGGLWAVGGFGVIHKEANGKQTWYSMKNGLPSNAFTRVAISPKGEVWIGGTGNALFRFDGTDWVDEGIKFPPQNGYSSTFCPKNIAGIDFDQNGSTWVINNHFQLYAQAYGQWINFPYPPEMIPLVSTGSCSIEALRVKSENDIAIQRPGCCSIPEPSGIHYDGKTWNAKLSLAQLAELNALLGVRHTSPLTGVTYPLTTVNYQYHLSVLGKEIFLPKHMAYYLDPGMYRNRVHMATDQNNVVLTDGIDFYHNATGTFELYPTNNAQNHANEKNSALLNFGSTIFYFEDGKKPWSWWELGVMTPYDSPYHLYPSVDQQNRVWFYNPKKGVVMLDDGNETIVGPVNPELSIAEIGGVLPLRDGRVVVGSTGVLWVFDGKNWQKFVIPGPRQMEWPTENELFAYLGEGHDGIVYAATHTGVYNINLQHKNFHASFFGLKDIKAVRLFRVENDGSMYYVNNKVVARSKYGSWQSFFFNGIEIEAATVDKDKAIWIYTNMNGLIRLAPDFFDSN